MPTITTKVIRQPMSDGHDAFGVAVYLGDNSLIELDALSENDAYDLAVALEETINKHCGDGTARYFDIIA